MTATFPTSYRTVAPASTDPRDQVASDALAEYLATHDPLRTADLTFPERTWERIGSVAGAEIWLITWPAGSSTGWHDHGSAAGAFVTLAGQLTEYVWTGVATASTLTERAVREFDGSHIHDVVNHGTTTAVSLHAYAPSLSAMTRYELVRGRLQVTSVEQRESW
jgi:predicted metal-dependent enzyme (double-stranded beta helix superfamily)